VRILLHRRVHDWLDAEVPPVVDVLFLGQGETVSSWSQAASEVVQHGVLVPIPNEQNRAIR
jgi:hypothetical protein